MKKVFFGVAAVAMLGLAACSNKNAENAETASVDTTPIEVAVATDTTVTVDSLNDSTAAVTETVTTEVAAAPAN